MALRIQGDEDEGLHFAVEPTGVLYAGKIERSAEALPGKPLPDYLSLQSKISASNTARVTVRAKTRKVAHQNAIPHWGMAPNPITWREHPCVELLAISARVMRRRLF